MILPDVNVLVHAFRGDSLEHSICRSWLDRVIESDAPFALSPLVLAAVIRIATNPRVYKRPSRIDDALDFCGDLLENTLCEVVEPGDRHWDIFRRLCLDTSARGPDTTDAWFAALAIESGCDWVTLDRGFARFPGLRWRVPD